MDDKVDKVVLFQLVLLFFGFVMEKRSAQRDLKRVTVVDIDNQKNDSDGTKETSNVGKDFVKFLKFSIIGSLNTRLKERKTAVDIGFLSDFIWIF